MRKSIKFLFLLLITFCLSGCSTRTIVRETEMNKAVVLSEESSTPDSNFAEAQTSVTDIIDIPGESFSLECTYDTGDYPLNQWKITANKQLNMTVKTKNLPDGYTVHIEHVHADVLIKSTNQQVDGITQDSMDDSDHRNPSKGFFINNTTSYNNIFAIEGYNAGFYQIWGYTFGDFGQTSSSYSKLTEDNLMRLGCYAEKIAIVYDIIITPPGYEEGYVRSVYSEVLIQLNPTETYKVRNNDTGEITYETHNIRTGEVISTYTEEEWNSKNE